eukprot:15884-Pleurochrysis_carterae.AAC.1
MASQDPSQVPCEAKLLPVRAPSPPFPQSLLALGTVGREQALPARPREQLWHGRHRLDFPAGWAHEMQSTAMGVHVLAHIYAMGRTFARTRTRMHTRAHAHADQHAGAQLRTHSCSTKRMIRADHDE